MDEFIVIVEAKADFEIATKLAERVLEEKIDWITFDLLPHLFRWSGLLDNTEYSCWKDILEITERLCKNFKFPRIRSMGKYKTDGQAVNKVITLINFLQHKQNRPIKAVIFMRDLDNQPDRKQHIEQVRSEHSSRQYPLEIIIGTPDRNREAWVLNGFIASTADERQKLAEIKAKLRFDPCKESHRLGSTSNKDPDRIRNPKFVLAELTQNQGREKQCWEETELKYLREKGNHTGLSAYIEEIEQKLLPLLDAGNRSTEVLN